MKNFFLLPRPSSQASVFILISPPPPRRSEQGFALNKEGFLRGRGE